jgi:hypothetical protein
MDQNSLRKRYKPPTQPLDQLTYPQDCLKDMLKTPQSHQSSYRKVHKPESEVNALPHVVLSGRPSFQLQQIAVCFVG